MRQGVEHVHEKIRSFKRKYYLNIFIRGSILTLSILFSYFLLAAVIEHNLWLGPWARFLTFSAFFGIALFCTYRFLKEPLQWWLARRGLSEEQSARIIGSYVPSVKDRLLNFIQLSAAQDSALAYASIQQKSKEFDPISFEGFIDIAQNKRYLKYLVIPIILILAVLVFNQSIITQSTDRILHFNRQYSPQAPFKFVVPAESLTAFYNEDLTIRLTLQGSAVPENVYLLQGNQRIKLNHTPTGEYTYTIEKIQEGFDFQFEAAGFFSDMFHVTLNSRPELLQFNVELEYPRYLQRKNDKLVNAGNLEIPEGTHVRWNLYAANTQKASFLLASENLPHDIQPSDNQLFTYGKEFRNPDQYEIVLENDKSKNKEKITYRVDVIKDQFPQITLNNLKDSILYKHVMLGGMVGDDYGVNQLSLHFRIRDENQKEVSHKSISIPLLKNQAQQSFFYNWSLDSLKLKPGHQLEYYMQVWDNDGVNGRKSTKTANYLFQVPTEDNLVTEINRSQNQTQQKIDQSVSKANKLKDKIEQANQKLKGKQSLDWQDRKMLEDIVQQKQSLDQMIEQLKEQNKLLENKKDAFTEQNERIREKAQQIQKLMEELMDEETKKLFDELQKLLKENNDQNQVQKLLDKLNQNAGNLEKELERTLELFKELQYEYKLDQTTQDLKKLVEDQKALLEKTEKAENEKKGGESKKDKLGKEQKDNSAKEQKDNAQKDTKGDTEKDSLKDQSSKDQGDKQGGEQQKDQKNQQGQQGDDKNKQGDQQQKPGDDNQNGQQQKDKAGDENRTESEKLAAEQEKLNEEFKETSEKIEELKKMGEELDKDDQLPSKESSEDVKQDQQESKDQLQKNTPSKAKAPQQRSMQKMQKMQQQMEGAQSTMEMEMDMQNIESLRQIIHGLVKLSFDQEGLMKKFGELSQSDPRFNTIAQQQLKLKDDAKVLEDSLLALGKKDPFMGSIVTKEVGELNDHLEKTIDANKERKRPQASSEMQMTMTSINNLALMLDDHFDMMMQMMANAQPSMKKGKQKGQKPSMSQMQQQLNQKIQELKGSGKSGRQLSEELAEMAAEQERIRKALQEMEQKMKENGGKAPGGGQIPAKMEQTEMDLVNKQLTDQLIKRQQEILTRLLETEKSAREQDLDDERKGETAKDYNKEIPKAFEEYLRLKEKEVELLKTVPPKLYPYYKKEVSEYFKRMGNQ